jgi:glutamate carboxypeptidase
MVERAMPAETTVAIAVAAAERARLRLPASLARLERLVSIDSGADAPAGREEVAGLLAEWAAAIGCEVELVSGAGGSAVLARLAGGGGPRVALLGHHDTVFPAGSAARIGFAVRDGRAFGPGVADMKGGLLLGLETMEALAAGERRFAVIDFVSAPDEETRPAGPPDGFDRIRGADACLVLECARENGDLVYQRKAQASLTLVAHGRGAHAGTHPERGRSALLALCREALRVDTLGGARPGLTVTVGTLHSGTHFATVPDRAEADVDVRAWDADDVAWALDEVRDTGVHDGVSFDLGRLSRWPGMAPTAASLALLEKAEALGPRLATPVGRRRSGGSSDGCSAAAAGIPSLDGLGPIGGHDHSPDEYIDLDSWPARCGLLAGVISAVPGAAAPEHAAQASATDGINFSSPMGMITGRPRTITKLIRAPIVPPCELLASTPASPFRSTAFPPLITTSPFWKVS